jgi:hypothetical protein
MTKKETPKPPKSKQQPGKPLPKQQSTTSEQPMIALKPTISNSQSSLDSDIQSLGLTVDQTHVLKRSSKSKPRVDILQEYQKRASGKDRLNLVVVGYLFSFLNIGHVDAGKSTLMGHVLLQVGEGVLYL